MLNRNDKIVIGLSGGKDSISLLYNLIRIQEKTYNSEPIVAVSIDEGIDNYRKQSIDSASKFCESNNIEHRIISFKERIGYTLDELIEKKKKESVKNRYACNYCALMRRRLLNDEARELGADVLALGHNLTDIAETFLMNILFNRLKLIANQYIFKELDTETNKFFIKKITPLMRIPEEEIFLYANIKKFDYYPSHCPYRDLDPILRKRVLEFIQICKKYSPEIEFNLFKSFSELSEILYKNIISVRNKHCNVCGYPSAISDICNYCKFIKELKY